LRVVVLTPYLPHRRVGHGGGTAVRDLVTHLAADHTVRLVSLVRPGEETLVAGVAELGAEVVGVPYLDRGVKIRGMARFGAHRARAWMRSRRSGYPFYVEKYGLPELVNRFVRHVIAFAPDAVQVEYLQLAPVLRALRAVREDPATGGGTAGRPRLLLNTHELGSVPRWRRADLEQDPWRRERIRREARRWEHLERDATSWADVTLCVTDSDRARLEAAGGINLRTVPLGMDTERIAPHFPEGVPPRFLYLGSFAHRPNRVAAELLVRQHWPAVAQRVADAELLLVGRGSRAFLAALPAAVRRRAVRVRALGFVEDLGGLLRQCIALVAPLTEGGGIKIKILEAMARGLPVVTTPIGAEGITAPADMAVWIVAADEEFTGAMLEVWRNPAEARRRAERARRLVEERFSWSALVDRLVRIYQEDAYVAGTPASDEGGSPC